MANLDLVKIEEINNLKLIYFYNTNGNFSSNKLLGLKIVYDNDKLLEYDYRDKYFQSFVLKVFKVYKKEKSNKKIILLGDITKKIISNYDTEFNNSNDSFTQKYGVSVFNSTRKSIVPFYKYIKSIFDSILLSTFNETNFSFIDILGTNNRYVIKYLINNNEYMFSFNAELIDYDTLRFKFYDINPMNGIIDAVIKIDDKYIKTGWKNKDESIVGTIDYNLVDKSIIKKTVYKNDIVDYKNDDIDVKEKDLDLVSFYFDILGLDKTNLLIKTTDSNYLSIYNKSESDEYDSVLNNTVSNHVYIGNELVSVLSCEKASITKSDGFDYPISIKKDIYTMKHFVFEQEAYVIIEKYSPMTSNEKDNKIYTGDSYNYTLLKVDNFNGFKNKFNIVKTTLLNEEVNTISKIKKLIIKMGD